MCSSDLSRLIKANIGEGDAAEFIAWCKVYSKLPKIEDIFAGRKVAYPGAPDVLFALISGIISYAVSAYKMDGDRSLSLTELDNMCRFVNGFPKDYIVCTYRNILQIEGLRDMLVNAEAFISWIKKSDDFVRNNRKLLDQCKF